MTSGCDGALWFTESAETNSVGTVLRSTASGVVTSYKQGLSPDASLEGITSGPDNNLWVVDASDPGAVLRVGAGSCATTPSAPVPVVVTPTFTG